MSSLLLAELDVGLLKVIGLVLFVTVFVGILAWTISRSRQQVDRWAELPLDEDPPR